MISTSRFFFFATALCIGCGRDAAAPAPAPAPAPATPAGSAAATTPGSTVDPWANPVTPPPADRASISKIVVTDRDGAESPLGDHLTKVTLLAFWSPSCKPCMLELPQLAKLATELHDPDLSVLAVAVETPDRAAGLAALADHHISLPVLFDTSDKVFSAVFAGAIRAIPATAVVASDGIEKSTGYESQSRKEFVASWKQRLAPHLK